MNNAMKLAMMTRGKDSRRDEHRDYERDYDRGEHRQDYDRRRYGYEDYGRDSYGRERRHYDRPGGDYPMEYRSNYESEQDYRPRYSREEGRSRYRNEKDEDEYSFRIKGKFGMRDEYARSKPEKLTRELAEKWVSNMDRADGRGKGGQWTMEQTTQLMKQKGYDFDPAVFYAVCNMLHSDYSKTLSKFGVSTPEAYAELARDWIEDDDVAAGEKKTVCYYMDIVK